MTLTLGTPLAPQATRVMLLGSGELGKDVIIALQRLGVETIAVDRYDNAPGQQVAHHARTITMSDAAQLRALIEAERPMLVVPEIEAIATSVLQELEDAGTVRVVPTARAARLTMDREGIRRLAAETLRVPTSPYRFCDSLEALQSAIDGADGAGDDDGRTAAGAETLTGGLEKSALQTVKKAIGYPCIVKPLMSSSGKGQSRIDGPGDVRAAWDAAMQGGRVAQGRVIVEGFIDFDYEITLLTVRALGSDGQVRTHFCEPIGHLQVHGDYVESWQPHPMSKTALQRAQDIALAVTGNLGSSAVVGAPGAADAATQGRGQGRGHEQAPESGQGPAGESAQAPQGLGIFGVELFVKGDDVWFSEVSPRPHDTGMVTMATQWQNQFELHARAILGLPADTAMKSPGASAVIYGGVDAKGVVYEGIEEALAVRGVDIRLFGKPESFVKRRMGVALAHADDVDVARSKARQAAGSIKPRAA